MIFDPNNKTTLQFVDEHDMVMCQNHSYNPDGDFGEGDSIGRTLDGYLAWRKSDSYIIWGKEKFVKAVKRCFVYKIDEKKNPNKLYIQGYRHPNRVNVKYNDMSRDHILYMLIFMKLVNDPSLDELIKHLRWKISDKFSFTVDSWIFMKSLKKNNKFHRFIYYLIKIPLLFFSVIWNKIIFLIGGFKKEVHQDNFVPKSKQELSKWKLFWRKIIYPIYSLLQTGFQLYVLPNSIGKRVMKKIGLWGTPNQNFVMKILFGGKVSEKEVYLYKSMSGGRWSGILNDINDRNLRIITNPKYLEANVLDVDLLHALYEESL
jgi:hypothetical protein